jgi:hypothetical protein
VPTNRRRRVRGNRRVLTWWEESELLVGPANDEGRSLFASKSDRSEAYWLYRRRLLGEARSVPWAFWVYEEVPANLREESEPDLGFIEGGLEAMERLAARRKAWLASHPVTA